MVVKLFMDYISQPSRSLCTFLKSTSIDHEIVLVDIFKGEHKSGEHAKSLPFSTVPAITDDGFCLSECVAIFRYLATTYESKVPAFWYPAEPRVRAKVEEYMSYHHTGIRTKCVGLILGGALPVKFGGPAPSDEKLAEMEKGVDDALDKFEQLFLCNGDFITGKECTFADLLATNEIMQVDMMCSKAFLDPRPKLKAYIDRVKAKLNPTFDEDCEKLKKFCES